TQPARQTPAGQRFETTATGQFGFLALRFQRGPPRTPAGTTEMRFVLRRIGKGPASTRSPPSPAQKELRTRSRLEKMRTRAVHQAWGTRPPPHLHRQGRRKGLRFFRATVLLHASLSW